MKKKFRIKIGDLFNFFNIDDENYEKINYIDRELNIKTPDGSFKKINALIKKTGNICEYTLKNGLKIKCDENHLIQDENMDIVHIKNAKYLNTINGIVEIISNEPIKTDDVYDMNLNYPHLYTTSDGIICHNTTLAKMIVKHLDCEHLYVNASDENSVDVMRDKIKDFASSVGWKNFKIVILDEADFLTANAQAALRNIMETYSKACRFILTCNYVEKITSPIQSRCQIFKIYPPSKKEVAIRMVDILKAEDVKYDIGDVAKIVENHYPDIRATIGAINLQVVSGKLEISSILDVNTEYKIKLLEFLMVPDKKEAWKLSRQLLMDAGLKDYSDVYRFLYERVDEYAKGKISAIILVLAEYQYKDALVVDKEINFAACLVSLLLELHK